MFKMNGAWKNQTFQFENSKTQMTYEAEMINYYLLNSLKSPQIIYYKKLCLLKLKKI